MIARILPPTACDTAGIERSHPLALPAVPIPTQRLTGADRGDSRQVASPVYVCPRRYRPELEGLRSADCHCCVRTLSKRHAHLPGRVVALHQSALRGAR